MTYVESNKSYIQNFREDQNIHQNQPQNLIFKKPEYLSSPEQNMGGFQYQSQCFSPPNAMHSSNIVVKDFHEQDNLKPLNNMNQQNQCFNPLYCEVNFQNFQPNYFKLDQYNQPSSLNNFDSFKPIQSYSLNNYDSVKPIQPNSLNNYESNSYSHLYEMNNENSEFDRQLLLYDKDNFDFSSSKDILPPSLLQTSGISSYRPVDNQFNIQSSSHDINHHIFPLQDQTQFQQILTYTSQFDIKSEK